VEVPGSADQEKNLSSVPFVPQAKRVVSAYLPACKASWDHPAKAGWFNGLIKN